MAHLRRSSRKTGVLLVLAFFLFSSFVAVPSALATNGMNLEGYGPIASGMGGASMAYDNGSAAVMNNPATLSLMQPGNRLDVALGFLGPNVSMSATGAPNADSSASAFFMPAVGWIQKTGSTSYGLAMFAQGGMGTEFDANSFLAAGSGDKVRSEVSVGRLLIPIAHEYSNGWGVGATLDFVWASMDLKMAMPGNMFMDMAGGFGGTQAFGTVSGSMMDTFGCAVMGGAGCPTNIPAGMIASGQGGAPAPVNWGRFDFSDDSAFSGKAKGTGFAGKIGGVYKVNSQFTLGATYHSKTALGDLEATGATVAFNANVDNNVLAGGAPTGAGYTGVTIPIMGKIAIKDFQWPQTIGVGAAYRASDKLLLVVDYKWINWEAVMKNFQMTFTADPAASQYNQFAAAFGGTTLNATLYQNWKDQNVFMLGAGYKATDQFTVRGGLNIANNPIPDQYLNSLFPAIVKNHVTLGCGYDIDKASAVNLSLAYAPEVKVNAGSGITNKHSQNNGQLMYSYRF